MTAQSFECRGASVSVGDKCLLQPLDLVISPGELVVIVGPNGAGKSTLLKLLAGDHRPSTGEVFYDGRKLSEWEVPKLALRRAVMAQSGYLSFPFTVLEVVRLGARLAATDRDAANNRAREALGRVDLAGYEGRFYSDLSGGEQQRVQLARTLCQVWDPVVHNIRHFLFLDEPTASLDIRHQLDILSLAQDYVAAGGGCIAVLHDLNIAAMFADRLIALSQGVVRADGSPREVLTDAFMQDVFEVPVRVGQTPRCDFLPFILPQTVMH
ncbi:iron complex transport system ATP-binding protein [Cohaesibacter sp. ES.047]|uniref:heme ABC transporter ATP-binding protein n=1 Tax=Cohaesibacter sp. ES.047 TaxID=1798205 RepID=UPI000BB95FEC|nr:heme ABC transporter ATP-binding protein [Cohaesibacter sp. ES.047]SNY91277.1 iron complex transport system ATP-binding protein [Cohaesibacter sp. ES.047]